jgi:hypothetical protein
MVLSDFVVLWRMCILYKMHVNLLILTATLCLATFGWIIILTLKASFNVPLGTAMSNLALLEQGLIYGGEEPVFNNSPTGMASLFLSFFSNLCATILVGARTL